VPAAFDDLLGRPVITDPFAALGTPAVSGLDDEQVRAAWRAIAAATHPDRPDGGHPAQYVAASGSYAQLRTSWGRNEALADPAADRERATTPFPHPR
jgi:curved DNA-binding protein CbpA